MELRSAIPLKPNVANILLFNLCEEKFVQHGSITITIYCNGLSLLILEEKSSNYASGPKSTLNCDSFRVRRLFNVCVRVFCAPNATILLVYIPAKNKISFIWKDDFFFPKSAFSVGRSLTHLANRKRIGWSIGSWTNWALYGITPRSLYNIRLSDVSEMFNCWERRWIDVNGASHTLSVTFCHSRNILVCTYCFWLFTLWFIDEDASFFQFFHKITNSWRRFSSSKIRTQFSHIFCNITIIFKVMFKHIHNRIGSVEG